MSEALPRGWVEAQSEDIVALNPRGFATEPEDDDFVSFVPMAAIEELSGRLNPTDLRMWSTVKKGYTRFQNGDVVLAKITPCMENGKFAVAKGLHGGRAAGTTELHVLRPTTAVVPEYLFHFFAQEGIRRDARAHMQGAAGQLRVPSKYVASARIPLPPLAEQHRIVAAIEEHLSRLDAAVAGLGRVQALLPRYRAVVLKAAVEGSLVAAEGGGERSYWRATVLAGVLMSLRNGISTKPSELAGQPILRISAVRSMTVNVHDVRYLPLKPDWESYLLEAGDLLFTRYNGNPDLVGACGVVPDAGRGVAFPDKLIRARFDQEQLLPRYAQVMMNSGPSRDFIRARVRTTAGQAGISGSDLKQCPIAIPPIGLQALIADEVDRHLSLIKAADTAVVSALARAAALRQSILARAFRGELVAQDPSDEPAEALLERIRAERAGVVPVKRAVRKKRVAGKK